MDKFVMAISVGNNFHYTVIKIDDFKNKDVNFYLALIQNSFPTREHVNAMLGKYRQASEKTLFSIDSIDALRQKMNNNKDILFGLVFNKENEWGIILK